MTVVSSHVARDLGLELGHVLAASHKVGNLFAGLLPLAEICRLSASDEDGEVVANSGFDKLQDNSKVVVSSRPLAENVSGSSAP